MNPQYQRSIHQLICPLYVKVFNVNKLSVRTIKVKV